MATCTPLAVLRSIESLLYLAFRRHSRSWHYQTLTLKFLIRTAAEVLPASHPSLLLLRLLLDGTTSAQLVTVYELGIRVIERCNSRPHAVSFRAGFLVAALDNGLDATFRPYADVFCATAHDMNDDRHQCGIAKLYLAMGRYRESADILRRCLSQLEDEGNEESLDSVNALRILARLQFQQEDLAGQETSLRRILEIVLARHRLERQAQFDTDALQAIAYMDMFYQRHRLNQKREALRLDFPKAFER